MLHLLYSSTVRHKEPFSFCCNQTGDKTEHENASRSQMHYKSAQLHFTIHNECYKKLQTWAWRSQWPYLCPDQWNVKITFRTHVPNTTGMIKCLDGKCSKLNGVIFLLGGQLTLWTLDLDALSHSPLLCCLFQNFPFPVCKTVFLFKLSITLILLEHENLTKRTTKAQGIEWCYWNCSNEMMLSMVSSNLGEIMQRYKSKSDKRDRNKPRWSLYLF